MSGHKVVSILDLHKEAYIHGGPVRRRKQTGIARFMSKKKDGINHSGHDLTEYIIGNKSTFKIRSHLNTITTGNDMKKRSSFEMKRKDKGTGNDDDDKDTIDADAMMMAAARGESISAFIAADDARKRKKSKQSQGSTSASAPVLLWKQSHCYIKDVTPLMTVDGEVDLNKQKREDEIREREELIKAAYITRHGMDERFRALGLANATSNENSVDGNAKKNVDGENEFGEITGGVPAHVDPNDPRIKETHVNGFVVHYFTTDKKGKLPAEMTSTAKTLLETSCGSLPSSTIPRGYEKKLTAVNNDIFPVLRHRVFISHSQYDQEEWCLVYNSVLFNYWHERLENSIIRAPDIFQYQVFAMGKDESCKTYGVVQCVLSTSALFIISRGSKEEFEKDNAVTAKKMPISALKKITIEQTRSTVVITGGPELNLYTLSFFSPVESSEFVVEVQRIWEMGSPAAASGAFPYTKV
eukprot:Tbor_TRINITY_DN2830_c0_g1::TRINITY_DN2830_c0_g1_i1::g.23177::m.23177